MRREQQNAQGRELCSKQSIVWCLLHLGVFPIEEKTGQKPEGIPPLLCADSCPFTMMLHSLPEDHCTQILEDYAFLLVE